MVGCLGEDFKMKYIIVKGKTEDGRVEYQVSDGEPYNGKNSGKERICLCCEHKGH